MPRRIGSPALPMACSANPTSSATKSACSTLPAVSDENSVSGMMPWTKSISPPDSCAFSASSAPLPAAVSDRCMPLPGWMRLPTTRPIASANVDITRK